MGFVKDYREGDYLERSVAVNEEMSYDLAFKSMVNELEAEQTDNPKRARTLRKWARKDAERAALANNRAKNLRSLLGRKLKKIKKG